MPDTPKSPLIGDLLLLDGFEYVLGDVEVVAVGVQRTSEIPGLLERYPNLRESVSRIRIDPDPEHAKRLEHWRAFSRAPAEDEALEAKHQANSNYKKSGLCQEEELVWCDPVDLIDELRTQAAALMRGNPMRAVWAMACVAVQVEQLKERSAGAWTLPGRHLLKPPIVTREVDGVPREVEFLPTRPKEAEATVRAILDHSLFAVQEG